MTEHRGGAMFHREAQAHKFIEWLGFQPSGSDICRALVTEYLLDMNPYSARISRLNSDDSVTYIGEYGYQKDEAELGQTVPGQVWRNRPTVSAMIASGQLHGNWSPDGKLVVLELRDHGAIQGFLSFRFVNPRSQEEQEQIALDINLFALPLSLYFSFQNRTLNHMNNGAGPISQGVEIVRNNHNGHVRLTQRQLQILRGMVEGKTNHDLAMDLGFSVSTIRHETMSIYKELAVSDRHEAARVAVSRGLIATAISLLVVNYLEFMSLITCLNQRASN